LLALIERTNGSLCIIRYISRVNPFARKSCQLRLDFPICHRSPLVCVKKLGFDPGKPLARLLPPEPAEHNISHVSLSSELLAVKMPQPRYQDNHQRNGWPNCIGSVLTFTQHPTPPTFPDFPPFMPPPPWNCLPICFVHMEMKWQTRMRAEVEQRKSGRNYVDTSKGSHTHTHTCAEKERLTHTNANGNWPS